VDEEGEDWSQFAYSKSVVDQACGIVTMVSLDHHMG